MRNDEFLVVTYCLAGVICLCFALAVYLYLRRPFTEVVDAVQKRNWSRCLKSAFPTSIFLLALSGFLFVDQACGPDYSQIVAGRAEILSVNQKHVAEGASSIVAVLFVWMLGVLLIMALWPGASVKGRSK